MPKKVRVSMNDKILVILAMLITMCMTLCLYALGQVKAAEVAQHSFEGLLMVLAVLVNGPMRGEKNDKTE